MAFSKQEEVMSKLECKKEDVQSPGLIYKAYSMPDLHRERHQRLSSRKQGKDTRTRFSKMPKNKYINK